MTPFEIDTGLAENDDQQIKLEIRIHSQIAAEQRLLKHIDRGGYCPRGELERLQASIEADRTALLELNAKSSTRPHG
jgi:hypothetical protein